MLMLAMFNLFLLAQDVAPAAAAAPAVDPTMPIWLQGLLGLISTVITLALIPYLTRKANEAEAEMERAQAETTNANVTTQSIIIQRLKAFIYRVVADVMEREFMRVVEAIARGELRTTEQIKTELSRLHAIVRDRAIAHFDGQGINIIAAAGDELLDSFIESAVNKFSPFPGSDTAKTLLTEHVSNWLVNKGVDYARNRWITGQGQESVAAHAAATGPVTTGEPQPE